MEGEWAKRRMGESGRSGLSRHSGLSGRFVGWRLPVRGRRFAVSPIRLLPSFFCALCVLLRLFLFRHAQQR
jgi:hypothetical protein